MLDRLCLCVVGLASLVTYSTSARAADPATGPATAPSYAPATAPAVARPPNVVIFYVDDMGYGDVGCFGAKTPTPNIDRLAKEGVRFTSYYAAQPVCSASRASLMTGCYPNRVGISGALMPAAKIGVAPTELMLPEMLRRAGYATGMVGKWHLGSRPRFLPTKRGFDSFYGLPYSNDMWPHDAKPKKFPPLPLYEDDRVIDPDVRAEVQADLQRRYAEHAVGFIEKNKAGPFFLYYASSMPHVPLFVGERFAGKTGLGTYADVIAEIDWSVGEVRGALERAGVLDETLIVFTSDNGPWLRYGNHGGSSGPLREGKGTVYEGGVRVPFVARYPKLIPAGGDQSEPAMSIDLLPTIAGLTGATGPTLPIDGQDVRKLLACEPGAKTPHEAFYFYYNANELQAVRAGKWKMILPHEARQVVEGNKVGHDGTPADAVKKDVPLSLYDLSADVGERNDLSKTRPEIVEQLMAHVRKARADLGDELTKSKGTGRRPAGTAE